MKKLLLSLLTLLFCSSLTFVQATDYYLAGTMKTWDTTDDANKMSLVSGTLYSKTISAMESGSYEFKISTKNWGESWGSDNIDNTLSTVTLGGSGNITFTLSTASDVTFFFDADDKKVYARTGSLESYTFTSGTTIYYDFTAYGGGINLFDGSWKSDVSSVIACTLSSDWTVTYGLMLFKSAPNSWSYKRCTSLPSAGQNMIVSTDGSTYTWGTYVPPVTPTVSFASLGSKIATGQTIKFAATSTNIDNPAYTFKVKKGSGAYGSAVTQYTFAEAGTYTVQVEADGDDDAHAETTQEVTVGAYNVLYYVKTNAWPQVNAHMWGDDPSTVWPGDIMSLNAATTTRNNYPVYSVAYTLDYTTIIFSNDGSSQSANLDIDTDKPYYYDGEWYATLAECDQPILTTNFYLAGSFNNWTPTDDHRFMKENEDDTEATVTIDIEEYSNITFKVIDNGDWRGCNPVKSITKDDRSVTILSDAEGNNVQMTPYAAGDYVFTLNLSTRELTVTYPDGEQMPIPTNIYLASDVLDNWAVTDSRKFDVDAENDIATLDVDLEEETAYAFKLVYNDAWLGANYDFKYYWCTDVPMIVDETQANLYTFKAGTYTFRYKISTGELSIVYPATSATVVAISEYEYATLYSTTAFDVPADVEAYIITGSEGIKLTMERIYRIPANTGVLLHAAQGNYNFYEGDGRYMDAISTNYLKGSTTDETISNDLVHYVLSYDEAGKVGLFWPYGTGAAQGVGSFENKAGKAYLEMPTQSAGVAARRGYRLTEQTEVYTSIENTDLQQQGGKYIHRGQLLIIHDGKIYNAQGARVQ